MTQSLHRRLRRPAMAVVLVVAVAALVGALPGGAATRKHAATKSPWNILYVSEQSGAFAVVGTEFLDGAIAGARILNATGGILGHKVTLKIVDNGSNPALAVQQVQQELGSGKYQEVVADVGAVSSAIAPLIAAHPGIIAAGAAATTTETVQAVPNMYFTGPTQQTQAAGAVAYAKKQGYKSIGMVTLDNANGRSYGGVYSALAAANGMSFSAAYVPPTSLDATPQLQQLLANKPDVMIMTGASSAQAFLPARAKLGSSIPVICDQGCAGSANWAAFTSSQLAGVKALVLPYLVLNDPSTKTPAYVAYLKQLRKIEKTPPGGYNAGLTSYEGLLIMRAAAKKCSCVDPATMAKVLESVTTSKGIPGWIGPSALFSPSVHSLIFPASSYVAVPALPLYNGFWRTK